MKNIIEKIKTLSIIYMPIGFFILGVFFPTIFPVPGKSRISILDATIKWGSGVYHTATSIQLVAYCLGFIILFWGFIAYRKKKLRSETNLPTPLSGLIPFAIGFVFALTMYLQ
jgi:hypothetical protein